MSRLGVSDPPLGRPSYAEVLVRRVGRRSPAPPARPVAPAATAPDELDRLVDAAADYIAPIRDAAGPAARARAVARADGARALMALFTSLPVEQATFSQTPEGNELRRWFRPDRRLPVDRAPIALLTLPATYREYLQGRSRQALRTNLSRAAAAGLKATVVESPVELAEAVEHIAWRRATTAAALSPLHARDDIRPRFRVAYDDQGEPVGMSQTVRDGSWAGLASLVTVPGHAQAQTARYLLHGQLIEDLIDEQVSRVVVGGSILLAPSGTRYFQRRIGYRPVRLRLAGHDLRRSGRNTPQA